MGASINDAWLIMRTLGIALRELPDAERARLADVVSTYVDSPVEMSADEIEAAVCGVALLLRVLLGDLQSSHDVLRGIIAGGFRSGLGFPQ